MSAETGHETEDNEYMSMHATEQLATPDDEYLIMKPQHPDPPGPGYSTDEGAVRLALGEEVVPPPFQPMQQWHFETKPQATGNQWPALDHPHEDQFYRPALPRSHRSTQPVPVQREVAGAPDVDMYTEHGGYDQRMNKEAWQPTRRPEGYPPLPVQQTTEFGYRREDRMLQEGSGQVERLGQMLPDVAERQIRAMLVECKWNVEEAFQRIRVNQMLELGLEGSTREKCQRALEHCQWKVDRAAAWLMDSSG